MRHHRLLQLGAVAADFLEDLFAPLLGAVIGGRAGEATRKAGGQLAEVFVGGAVDEGGVVDAAQHLCIGVGGSSRGRGGFFLGAKRRGERGGGEQRE